MSEELGRESRAGGPISRGILPAFGKPLGKFGRQPGVADFLLGRGPVIINAAKVNQLSLQVIDDVAGPRVTVSWLSDRANIDKIFQVLFNLNQLRGLFPNLTSSHEDTGNVSMAVKTDVSKLVGKVRHGIELVGHVSPCLRLVEG